MAETQDDSRVQPPDIVVTITMASADHTLVDIQDVINAVWGLYAGALLAAAADSKARARLGRWRLWREAGQGVYPRAIATGRPGHPSAWHTTYSEVARDLKRTRSAAMAGAKVTRLEHHSPLVLEVLFSAAFAPLAALIVIRATTAAVIRTREGLRAAEYRQREREIALSIREAIAEEIRRNGLGAVNPAVVTAAMATQAVPASELASSAAIKDIIMTISGASMGK